MTDVHLVETSPYMRTLQKEKLAAYEPSIRIHWHDRIQDIPVEAEDTFTAIAAHEFFDALPIHAFEKKQSGFREVFVDLDPASKPSILTGDAEKDALPTKLRYVLSPTPTLASRLLVSDSDERYRGLSDGMRVEMSPEAYEIAQHAAELVAKKGAGLVIDYGDEKFFSTSFRVSLTDWKLCNVLIQYDRHSNSTRCRIHCRIPEVPTSQAMSTLLSCAKL